MSYVSDLADLSSALAAETDDDKTQGDLLAAAHAFRNADILNVLAQDQDAGDALQNLAKKMQGEAQKIAEDHVFYGKLAATLVGIFNALNPFDGPKIVGLVGTFLKNP